MLVTRLILILLVLQLVTAVVMADQTDNEEKAKEIVSQIYTDTKNKAARQAKLLKASASEDYKKARQQARDLIKQANEQANQMMAKTKPKIRQFEMNARQKAR